MKMCVITAHAGAESAKEAISSWTGGNFILRGTSLPCPYEYSIDPLPGPIFVEDGKDGMLAAYQRGFERAKDFDILAFIHDDVIIHHPFWYEEMLRQFEDPEVGLVGFGGATGHGDPDMYQKPYEYQQLARRSFYSNMRDAEVHGKRFAGARDVAVLDGFALIVRRELLEKVGGWPLATPIGYVCYDYWLSCIARRLGFRIRLVGVACDHLGGQTFVKLGVGRDPKYWDQYLTSHEYIYNEFRDVLPFEVP